MNSPMLHNQPPPDKKAPPNEPRDGWKSKITKDGSHVRDLGIATRSQDPDLEDLARSTRSSGSAKEGLDI
ncbi:hypothetical protein PG999_009966 [Apiospora kogelbergensis]|uniref:Uncharacterized protein n=1 Tax=Apiospora kogelbergensis TaxID=1337665 RepID=A0AAW0QKW7_9PEZI